MPVKDPFDVEIFRSKLAEYYKRTATVPTSGWSRKSAVNIHKMYTGLSWVKKEQSPVGSSRTKLNHYTDVFAENENGLPSNRILVQGETGIGKSTFVKKLAKDWAELVENTKEKSGSEAKRFRGDGEIGEEIDQSNAASLKTTVQRRTKKYLDTAVKTQMMRITSRRSFKIFKERPVRVDHVRKGKNRPVIKVNIHQVRTRQVMKVKTRQVMKVKKQRLWIMEA